MVMHARACNLMQWKLNNKYWLILKINRCIEYWENATEPSQKYRNFYKSLKLRRVDFYILMANKVFTLGESFKQVHQNKKYALIFSAVPDLFFFLPRKSSVTKIETVINADRWRVRGVGFEIFDQGFKRESQQRHFEGLTRSIEKDRTCLNQNGIQTRFTM